MKPYLLLLVLLSSCAVPTQWADTPQPLNFAGDEDVPDTYTQLHRENIRTITHNPVFELWEENHNQ